MMGRSGGGRDEELNLDSLITFQLNIFISFTGVRQQKGIKIIAEVSSDYSSLITLPQFLQFLHYELRGHEI